MNITMLEPSRLKNYEKNARTHSDEQIEQIIKSIKDYGFNVPVEVNPDFVILSGHAWVMAATKMGLEKIPVVIHEHLTQESKQKGYILAANKIAMNAGWDDGILTDELRTLMDDPDFDMESTGFGLDELSAMFPPEDLVRFAGADDIPETPAEPKTKLGDIWVLGNHRLMCGDSTNIDTVDKLMDGIKADMVFTDPPYNVAGELKNYAADVSKSMKDLSNAEWDKGFDITPALNNAINSTKNSATYYIWTSRFLIAEIWKILDTRCDFCSYLVWSKPNPMPSLSKRHPTWNTELCA